MKPKKDINEKYNNLIWSDNDQKAKTPPEVWHSIHEEFGKYIFFMGGKKVFFRAKNSSVNT